jgi:NADH-quinone oxidoreductase subunit A
MLPEYVPVLILAVAALGFGVVTIFLSQLLGKPLYRSLGLFGLMEMGIFIALLGGGFVYAWKIGALDW